MSTSYTCNLLIYLICVQMTFHAVLAADQSETYYTMHNAFLWTMSFLHSVYCFSNTIASYILWLLIQYGLYTMTYTLSLIHYGLYIMAYAYTHFLKYHVFLHMPTLCTVFLYTIELIWILHCSVSSQYDYFLFFVRHVHWN